jgi:hypothetical protein
MPLLEQINDLQFQYIEYDDGEGNDGAVDNGR